MSLVTTLKRRVTKPWEWTRVTGDRRECQLGWGRDRGRLLWEFLSEFSPVKQGCGGLAWTHHWAVRGCSGDGQTWQPLRVPPRPVSGRHSEKLLGLRLQRQHLHAWQGPGTRPVSSQGFTWFLSGSNLSGGWEVGLGYPALPSRPSPWATTLGSVYSGRRPMNQLRRQNTG